jgi:membrane protein DedA with SNARE-associated domain
VQDGRVRQFGIVAAILGAPAVLLLGAWLVNGPPTPTTGLELNMAPVVLVPLALIASVIYLVISAARKRREQRRSG